MKNKSLVLKIVSILMTIVSFRGVIFVFTDKEFDYAGLPMPLIYVLLCLFIVLNVIYSLVIIYKEDKVKFQLITQIN